MTVLFLLYRAIYSEKDDARYYIFQDIWEEQTTASGMGTVDRICLKQSGDEAASTSIYLKNITIFLSDSDDGYHLDRLLVYYDAQTELQPGNQINIQGTIQEFSQPTNPGQFDQKAYYKEKGIYYQMRAEKMLVTDAHYKKGRKYLYDFRDRLASVYEKCLPKKECGIVTAMILGDKSLLDMEIKQLYQNNGIGHLLAISGLHITILGMALYRLLQKAGTPRFVSVPFCIILLLLYGRMTDFSISTSRAVIMMILLLIGGWIGRTYDMQSALAFSAVIILLQKPFALFSCSFLLSFGAIAGIALIQPRLQLLVYGGRRQQRERRRRIRRFEKELRSNYRLGNILAVCHQLKEKTVGMLLASLSVQWMITPVMLYFFYEIPLYSVIINLIVIPLASFLVILSFVGGLFGCLSLLPGKLILGSVYYLLGFYERICRIFQRLPGQLQILGRPSAGKILIYFCSLLLILWLIDRQKQKDQPPRRWGVLVMMGLFLIFLPGSKAYFQLSMLDVGQGDCLYIHSDAGENILLDGGSTSASQVGIYRIIPFLKYYGVRRIDYMILTHPDEDHMNGLMEVLESKQTEGIAVRRLLVPEGMDQEEEMQKITALAGKHGVPVYRITEGKCIQSGKLSLQCLHPTSGFQSEFANAGSVTLSLQYEKFSCLLTGDLEGEGEEAVANILQKERESRKLPSAYTMLKVAHHGSKNSTSTKFLELVRPRIAFISCGRQNRYGHPHKELLQRLEEVKSDIFRTDENGAVEIKVSGGNVVITGYRSQK